MTQIVEVDERGTIQLPTELLVGLKPRARFVIEQRGTELVLQPVADAPFWMTATPEERAAAFLGWAASERPVAPVLSDAAVSREQMYDE